MKGKRWELPQKFRTIYWQNFALTASIVMLTLALLGASFFALSYAYAADERSDEMAQKASVVARLVASYASSGDVRDMREMAGVAASMTDVDFLVCSTEGSVLLTTDENLVDHVLTVPSDVMETALSGERYSARTTLGGIYESKRFVVGVPIESDIWTVGAVFAVTETGRLTTMWRAFFAMFLMTSVIVLLLSFVASAWVSMRAFNAMADSLQETERQRREFIANISHELKTPMTSIAGYTDGILDGTIPPEKEKEYLHIISDESRRLSRLVRRMLEVSQLQSRDVMRSKAPFDVCESMRRVLISMEKKITDRGLDVEADIPDEPVTVLGDNDLITQVIYNLLENATKFARAGSTLYLGLAVTNGRAVVSVRNEGDTIPAEEIPLLFERFHKSDKSRSEDKDGVGLGLYIVKTILEQHHEHIAVTSENGLTTFAFTLSLANSLAPQP